MPNDGGRGLLRELAVISELKVAATLNRSVALGMAFGRAVGLELVDTLVGEPSMRGYHLLPSVRGDLLAKLGRYDEAGAEFARAAALTQNVRERALLLGRAAMCTDRSAARLAS